MSQGSGGSNGLTWTCFPPSTDSSTAADMLRPQPRDKASPAPGPEPEPEPVEAGTAASDTPAVNAATSATASACAQPRGGISCDLNALQRLHEQFSWVPGAAHIRPDEETLLRKDQHAANVAYFYESNGDAILEAVFGMETHLNAHGKLVVRDKKHIDAARLKVLAPNQFPYQLPPGSNHYVMWFSYRPLDVEITAHIDECLLESLGHGRFEFVWYENPKMTIPDIYHVQVFWTLR